MAATKPICENFIAFFCIFSLCNIICITALPTSTTNKSTPVADTKVMNDPQNGNSPLKITNNKFERTQALNSSEISETSDQMFLTADDRRTQEEWGGNCTLADWDNCKVIKTWFGKYFVENEADPSKSKWMDNELDCVLEPVLCMKNGWTVNRCHVLCMSKCNKEMQYRFDKYVAHENECKAHAHG